MNNTTTKLLKQNKMENKNIWLLPTKKMSRLYLRNGVLKMDNSGFNLQLSYQNIYITSDDEIKEGDWVFNPYTEYPYKADYKVVENFKQTKDFHVKKIILTTDQDLIKAGVQAIDDEFLEWFVKNPSCEKVEVKKRYSDFTVDPFVGYKIIIPKEDPFEKSKLALRSYLLANNEKVTNDLQEMREKSGIDRDETLEEAVKNKLRKEFENLIRNKTNSNVEFLLESNNTNYISWLENKWQKERMYSEEEVMNIIDSFIDNLQDYTPTFNSRQEWFEQFKKK